MAFEAIIIIAINSMWMKSFKNRDMTLKNNIIRHSPIFIHIKLNVYIDYKVH